MFDVLVLGGGPAGVSAALYAKARGMNTAIIEKHKIGGLIGTVSKVSHFVGLCHAENGKTFAARLRDQLAEAGIEVIHDEVKELSLQGEIKHVHTVKGQYEAKAVVLALGSRPKALGVKNENLVSGSAADHAPEYQDRICVIAGGSDGAAKECLYLARFAKEVHMVQIADKLMMIREFRDQIEADSKIKVHLDSEIISLRGDHEAVEVEILDHKSGEKLVLQSPCGIGVFAYIGQTPNSEILPKELLAEDGYVKADEAVTAIPGVFACGDLVVKKVRQVSTATAEGTLAGIKAAAYVPSK